MIIRRGERPRRWTTIPNDVLEDERLTWEARGLLAFLLSKPDTWNVNREHLATQAPNGVRSVRTILSALEAAGYLVRRRTKGDGGRIVWECLVYDQPQTQPGTIGALPTGGRSADGSCTGGPSAGGERAALVRTDLPSTEEAKTEEEPAPAPPARATETDPVKKQAHRLAVLAFEQDPKPVTRGGFPAVMARLEESLRAGYVVGDLERAIAAGPVTWTADGLTTAVAKANPRRRLVGGFSSAQHALADYLGGKAEGTTR